MVRLFLGVICLVALSSFSNAQNVEAVFSRQLGTISAKFAPQFSSGSLHGCTVEFVSLLRDWTYRQGGFTRIDGSFGFTAAPAGVFAFLKVVVNDVELKNFELTPASPETAYFISKKSLTTSAGARVTSTKSDTPGGLFVIFQPLPTMEMIYERLHEERVAIAFARTKGGQDVRIDVEIDVASRSDNGTPQLNPQTGLEFSNCMDILLKAEQLKLRK